MGLPWPSVAGVAPGEEVPRPGLPAPARLPLHVLNSVVCATLTLSQASPHSAGTSRIVIRPGKQILNIYL